MASIFNGRMPDSYNDGANDDDLDDEREMIVDDNGGGDADDDDQDSDVDGLFLDFIKIFKINSCIIY